MQQRGSLWPSSAVPYPEKLAEKRMLTSPSQNKNQSANPPPLECLFAWKRHSFNHIAAIILFNLIPAIVSYLLVYTYYKQTIDSTHTACLLNGRSTVGAATAGSRRRADRSGYSRIEADDRASPSGMTTARLQYAPAQGGPLTPRQRRAAQQAPYTKRGTTTTASGSTSRPVTASGPQSKRSFVSRGINRSHRPPPLIPSPSPLGLDSIPGAASYNNQGRSRVYAAFAAPVCSSEYDKFV